MVESTPQAIAAPCPMASKVGNPRQGSGTHQPGRTRGLKRRFSVPVCLLPGEGLGSWTGMGGGKE